MKSNKYHARKVTLDGHTFDSTKEARRFFDLTLLERTGKISGLEKQPEFILLEPFTLGGTKHRGIVYRADFRYQNQAGETVVEDVKGVLTEVYKIKKKLFLAKFGDQLKFLEV